MPVFFCQEHERREGIAAIFMGEGRWVFRLEALESVELCEFFRDGSLAPSSKFFKASIEAILLLLWFKSLSTVKGVGRVSHNIITDVGHHTLISDGQIDRRTICCLIRVIAWKLGFCRY